MNGSASWATHTPILLSEDLFSSSSLALVIKALGAHPALAPFVAPACVATIAIICASYSQIIELFPGGGGDYLVASKLLSPNAGVVSGCALLVDSGLGCC
jgi:amino acid transporter